MGSSSPSPLATKSTRARRITSQPPFPALTVQSCRRSQTDRAQQAAAAARFSSIPLPHEESQDFAGERSGYNSLVATYQSTSGCGPPVSFHAWLACLVAFPCPWLDLSADLALYGLLLPDHFLNSLVLASL
jgi:hypothetical protein